MYYNNFMYMSLIHQAFLPHFYIVYIKFIRIMIFRIFIFYFDITQKKRGYQMQNVAQDIS